jgi:hypothetical protein
MRQRPLAITVIGWIFIAAGSVGLSYHATKFNAERPFDYELVLVCLIRLLAILGGVFMLRGHNWARGILAVWMVYHIVLSAFHTVSELAMHTVLFGILAYFLFRPQASAFFRGSPSPSAQGPTNDEQPAA